MIERSPRAAGEIRRRGTLLERDEGGGPSVMPTGDRLFATEKAARAAEVQEANRLRGETILPVDGDTSRRARCSRPRESG